MNFTSPQPKKNGETRLNSSIRTNSTKSTECSSSLSLSSYANLTGSLISEDTASEFTGLQPDHITNTYERKSSFNKIESCEDEVDYLGYGLGVTSCTGRNRTSSICSNSFGTSFLEKVGSLEITKKSKMVTEAHMNSFDSNDHLSAKRRSMELLSCMLDDNAKNVNPVISVKKKEATNKRDLCLGLNDIESKSTEAISKRGSVHRKKERAMNQENKAAYKPGKPRGRKTPSSSQLSHGMNDPAQTHSSMDNKPAQENQQRRRHSVVSSSMNGMNNRPTPTVVSQHTRSPRNRRKSVRFSETELGEIQHALSNQPKMYVKNLPWTDHKGKEGEYSGMVNGLMQPHGKGTLKYSDSTCLHVTWVNGSPKETTSIYSPSAFEGEIKLGSKVYLPGFDLGDTARPEDMIIEDDEDQALANIKTLNVHDLAFIRRPDGVTWTYAVLANFFAKRGKITSMRFVTDYMGSTETIEKRDWRKRIRMLNIETYTSPSCSSQEDMNYVAPDSPCSSEGAVKEGLRLDEVKEFFKTSEKRRPRYIQLS